jgi:hypothetical protein
MTDTQRHSFNWQSVVERNREALLRIIAVLIAMAGPDDERTATLPRHLRNCINRILRPAESAVRRLIVIAARGIEVAVRPSSERKGSPTTSVILGFNPRTHSVGPELISKATNFPLLDPRKRFDFVPRPRRAKTFPRITCIGLSEPTPIPDDWLPSPDDEMDAAPVYRRLTALKHALEDLDKQAKRLARWRARRDRGMLRSPRFSPMRPGWPPGHRKRPSHEVDEILRDLDSLARTAWADTS